VAAPSSPSRLHVSPIWAHSRIHLERRTSLRQHPDIIMLTRNIALASRSAARITRRHFAAAAASTSAKRLNLNGHGHEAKHSGALSYVPEGSDGRFYIEQLCVELSSAVPFTHCSA
jgi:hypothetical protein